MHCLINLCGNIPQNRYDGTESNFVAILQLSVSNRNAIDLCPVLNSDLSAIGVVDSPEYRELR
jgi:hypothetical protein